MLKYIITAAAALIASPAAAQSNDFCAALGDLAATALETRYNGGTMSGQIAVIKSIITDPDALAIAQAIIIEAYKAPAHKTPQAQAEAILEFRARWELLCYEATTDYT